MNNYLFRPWCPLQHDGGQSEEISEDASHRSQDHQCAVRRRCSVPPGKCSRHLRASGHGNDARGDALDREEH